jgi:hypothetical protein
MNKDDNQRKQPTKKELADAAIYAEQAANDLWEKLSNYLKENPHILLRLMKDDKGE